MRRIITLLAAMASLGVSSVWARLFKLQLYSLALMVFYLLSGSTVQAQFYDGFESGNFSNWTDNSGGAYSTIGVTTFIPRTGFYSLELTGDGTHGGGATPPVGLNYTFAAGQVSEVAWSFKVPNTAPATAYVTLSPAGNYSSYVFFAYVAGGNLIFTSPSYTVSVNPNTWYDVVVNDINWTAKTYDVYLNGLLVQNDRSFRTTSISSASALSLYNFQNGTAFYDNISINSAPACSLAASITSQVNVDCNGASSGEMTVTATGGSANYNYVWSNGDSTVNNSATTNTITGLAAGTYTVTITDNGGCTATASATITEPATSVSASAAVTSNFNGADISCNGASDGEATVTPSGGTPGYTYLWDANASSQTTATATSLSAGNYTVTVTDNNGCTTTASVSLTEPTAVTSSINVTKASCSGTNDWTATASGAGGTAGYTYLWDDLSTAAARIGLPAGTYSVTVTDGNGCTDSTSVTFMMPTPLNASITTDSNVSCNGGSDAAATASQTGGSAPYTYLWDANAGSQTTATATGLSAGTYSVTVTDLGGCTDVANITISQPSVLGAGFLVGSTVNPVCFGDATGEATVNAGGGTTPYTYLWDANASSQTTATATGLTAGSYSVTVTDAKGCTSSASTVLTQPSALNVTVANPINPSCNGTSDAGASTVVSGGTGPYTYLWNTTATTASISGVPAGTYTVVVTDANSCTATDNITLANPASLTVATSVDSNASCNGFSDGGVSAVTTNGQIPLTYSWSSGQSTLNITGVGAGTYTITVTDANGCTDVDSSIVTEPATLVASASLDSNASCNGFTNGGGTASATGGTMPYTYLWSNSATTASITGVAAGTYTVTIEDANGCSDVASFTVTEPATLVAQTTLDSDVSCNGGNDGGATASATGGTTPYAYSWSNSATTASILGVSAGSYSVTITDANGCTSVDGVTISEPTVLSSSMSLTNVSCNGFGDGTATVTPTGGTSPYSYSWTNSATTANISGLTPGTYSVIITDANGCTTTNSASITEPATLVSSVALDSNVSCFGGTDGSATASATGGTAPYTYSWDNGDMTASSVTGAGTYAVTITDANGCTDSSSITITQPGQLFTGIVSPVNPTCFGEATGSLLAQGGGGSTPYTFAWSNGATTAAVSNIPAGTYTVTITDANGCTQTDSETLVDPVQLTTSIVNVNDPTCFGSTDASALVVATGGTAPYTYAWTGGSTLASISGVGSGQYFVTVTDAVGCTSTDSVFFTDPVAIVVSTLVDSNASCNGAADGGSTASAVNGVLPYSYTWSNGATGASATGLAAGSYTVLVTDNNGCTGVGSVTITEPAGLNAATVVDSNVSCNGGTDGGATASATGGTMPYTYAWSNSPTTASISGVPAGTYTVTIEDANGCTDVSSVTIIEPTSLIAATTLDSNVNCNGGSDGGATASATGGTMPYTYLWSNSATTASITGVPAGSYSVVITDANGCNDVASVTITQPAVLVPLANVDNDITCNGANDGAATASATGGTSPYTYNWSTGSSNASISGLSAGSYSVTITDNNGCSDVTGITINEPAVMVATSALDSNVSCFGGSDGSGSVTVVGGTMPYTYLWSNGSTAASTGGVVAGTYSVTVTDANGCTDNASITINEPGLLFVGTTNPVNVLCSGGATGEITAQAGGGTSPFTYNWSNNQSGATITGLTAGTYTVTVTDANGCTAVDSEVLGEPNPITNNIANVNDPSCFGSSDASAISIASGGTGPYTYSWSNSSNSATISGASSGTYYVTITDANACTSLDSVTFVDPPAIAISFNVDSIPSCNGFSDGGATASATNGSLPYTFAWSSGSTTASATGLAAGTYTVTVTDNNGCSSVDSVVITEPTALAASTTVDSNATCNGAADGGATVNATGGTAPYTYFWSNSATTASVTGLAAGSYSVLVTDANGCSTGTSVTIAQPAIMVSNAVLDSNASCNGAADGGATASATGGTMPYTYAWSNGATTASTVTGAGTYQVTITDANGCTDSSSITITEPTLLVASAIADSNVNCNGGSDGGASASATGGTGMYTYLWSNGAVTSSITGVSAGTYNVTITDANGCTDTASATISEPASLIAATNVDNNVSCNGGMDGGATASATGGTMPYTYMWSNMATTASITGLAAGSYSVTIIDANGCTDVSSATITEPATLVAATVADSNVSCNGGMDGGATASATGGTAPYTYLWSNSATTASITGVMAGSYSVFITDANGCTDISTVSITEPASLTSATNVDSNVSCNGGTDGGISASATGGTSPYIYFWSDGSTGSAVSGLAAGTYFVTVVDINGCTTTDSATVTEPTPLVASTTPTGVSCNGDTDGSAIASAMGGTSPYTYLWSTGATTASISSLAPGTYDVTVTDGNGCTDVSSATILEPAVLTAATALDSNVSCNGGMDGSATVTGTGGTMPYSYNWSSGSTMASSGGVSAGTYYVTITDANGCTATDSAVITEPTLLFAGITATTNPLCFGDATGTITGATGGATPPYSYAWNNGDTTLSISGLVAGTYTLTVTDSKGCTRTATTTITQPNQLVATVANAIDPTCFGGNDGSMNVVPSGGVAPFTFVWSNGGTANSISGLVSGTYSVTVTDANGCTAADSGTLVDPAQILTAVNVDSTVSCNGGTDGGATVSVTGGGVQPLSYLWSNGATTASMTDGAGTYYVTVTDNNGCTAVDSAVITEPAALVASTLTTDVSCNGGTDGSATASATGGITPYSYMWSNMATTASITGMSAGTYSVTVTDANGCTDVTSATIVEPAVLVSSVALDSNVSCNGGTDGAATASAVGGTSPYTYGWSNGATTASMTDGAGTYVVTVTDANGCSDTSSITITEPTLLVATASVDANVSCNSGSDGGATVNATGGSAGSSGGSSGGSGPTLLITEANPNSPDFVEIQNVSGAPLNVSGYKVIISSSYSNISQANSITWDLSGTMATDEIRYRQDAGGVNLWGNNMFWNSSAPSWAILVDGSGNIVDAIFWGWDAASISTFSTTVGGQTYTNSGAWTGPGQATNCSLSYTRSGTSDNNNESDWSCGPVTKGTQNVGLSLSAGASYAYSWSNGDTTSSISGVPAGTYSVTVTDANGCTDTASVVITEPTLLVSSTMLDSNVSCNGGMDGGATASATGGTMPYTYAWSNAATSASITGVTAGTYSVTITDANGCTDSSSVVITEPTLLVSSTMLDSNVSCNGGMDGGATASAMGGTMPYTYAWSNAATSASISGVMAGTYSVTITDANGCTDSSSVIITEPTLLVSSTTLDNNISCNGGTDGGATANATGGTAPYSYSWSNSASTASITGVMAGTYSVTITDANGCTDSSSVTITEPALLVSAISSADVTCNGAGDGTATASATGGTMAYSYSWSNMATTATITGLTPGTYSVTITDANGCTDSSSVVITEPTVLTMTTALDSNVSCFGFSDGGGTATAAGGSTPYTYNWSNGDMGASLTGVAVGTYTVTVTDANGCTEIDSVIITQPTPLFAGIASTVDIGCFGDSTGSIMGASGGGTAPYMYAWSNGDTTLGISGLPAGTYTLTVTDFNGCTQTATTTLIQPNLLTATVVNIVDPNCFGSADGSMDVVPSGGTTPYSFTWSTADTTSSLSGLTSGTYGVTVVDANGCVASDSATLADPLQLIANAMVDSTISCNGLSDGGASVSVTNGNLPFTYAWSNGATTVSITGVPAGTYFVTVTDGTGCTSIDSAVVTEPAVLVASATVDNNVSCNGLSDGMATGSATGGTMPYSYSWTTGDTTASISGLPVGTYGVTITDVNGCSDTASVTITEPVVLVASSVVDSNVSCNGGMNGGATASATGGTMPYAYAWSNGATSASLTGAMAGTYTVVITDSNGCTSSSTVVITEPTLLVATASLDSNVTCNGFSNGGVSVATVGGVAPYTYAWSNGDTTASVAGLAGGTYDITVTDANGCTAVSSATVFEPMPLVAATTGTVNPLCYGDATGMSTVQATGGTAPYTYLWSNGITTDTLSNVAAGSYIVTVTDQNGCVQTATAIITEPTQITSTFSNVSDPNCNGATDGTAVIVATGGTSPYTYAWSNGGTQAANLTLAAGVNTVTVTDANGCTHVDTVILTDPAPVVVSVVTTSDVLCNGGTTGSATVVGTGGVAPFSYTWSSGTSGITALGLAAGTYTVTMTDANGCTDTASVTIAEPTAITVSQTVNNNVTCNGLSDGSATVSATGGVPGYTYNWSNGSTGATATGLAAGAYTVTVTDANGCTETVNVSITEPAALSLSLGQDGVICFGDATGTAFVTNATGGTSPYTVTWNTGATGDTLSNVAAGVYTATLTDANGCTIVDSVEVIDATPIVPVIGTIAESCETDAPVTLFGLPAGGTFSGPGVSGNTFDPTQGVVGSNVITYTITGSKGCTYTATAEAIVRANPVVTIGSFADSICIDEVEVACPVGTPAGGVYSGPGVQGVKLFTSVAGIGQHTIVYTYTDQNGCSGSDSAIANVVKCLDPVGTDEVSDAGFEYTLYPNPNHGTFRIRHNSLVPLQGAIYSMDGKLIKHITFNTPEQEIILENKARGMYLLKITGDGVNENVPFIIH